MSFFENFPRILYRETDTSRNRILITNILRRVKLSDSLKTESSFFLPYDVKDGETPNIIADKLYDDPKHYWIIMLMNNMVDPYSDWPMDIHTFESYLDEKYPGMTIFVFPGDIQITTGLAFVAGDILTIEDFDNTRTTTATVISYDSTLGKLAISPIDDGLVIGSQTGNKDKITSVIHADGTTTTLTGSASIFRTFEKSWAAVHHFEDDDKNRLDAWYMDPLGGYPLLAYLQGNPNNNVTNREYEDTINEGKRSIILIRPELLQSVIQGMRTSLNTNNNK